MNFFELIAVGLDLVIVSIFVSAAYRLGHANGRAAERLRFHEVETRMEQRLVREAMERKEEWEEELDV